MTGFYLQTRYRKGMIIFELQDKQLRYGELQDLLPNISNRMLTRTLAILEDDKIVIKTPLPNQDKIFTYTLSAIGKKFIPVFMSIRNWALEYRVSRRSHKTMVALI